MGCQVVAITNRVLGQHAQQQRASRTRRHTRSSWLGSSSMPTRGRLMTAPISDSDMPAAAHACTAADRAASTTLSYETYT